MKYLTFIHRSPYATWNPLSGWIRKQGALPEEVVVLHLPSVERHGVLVMEGVRRLLEHYGDGTVPVRALAVHENVFGAWRDAVRALLESGGRWAVDVTAARTLAKLGALDAIRAPESHEVVYLDVEGYRYDPKPFPWIPYNLQTVRSLRTESGGNGYRRVQFFGAPPGIRAISNIPGLSRVDTSRYEATLPWESLVVLFNEAGASHAKNAAGAREVQLKLPHLGITLGNYDLESRRFRLRPYHDTLRSIKAARERLPGVWQGEVPTGDWVLESLSSARLLPFRDQARFEERMHEVASLTRGPNPGTPLKAFAMDTNMFYLDFFTAVAHTAKVPMTRIPVVASSISQGEIRNKMTKKLPKGSLPQRLVEAGVHHSFDARCGHAAHEEFEMLRTRCRMNVIQRNDGATGEGANDVNDERIVRDLVDHQNKEKQDLLVVSNDDGFCKRARQEGLDCEQVNYPDPDEGTVKEADIDQVAYLVYRLALGFGRVSLKGLDIDVYGDHRPENRHQFLHENIRVHVPDQPWTRGFLHEVGQRELLGEVVREGRVWL